MARKTLLTESEIRQFMKLANIKPLQEMGGPLPVPGMRDDEEDEDPPGMRGMGGMREAERDDEEPPGMRDMREEEEMEMDVEETPAPEGGEELDMGAEMGDEPAGDMEMDMDMGAEDDLGGKEEQFADIVDKLADLLGLDADVEVGGDEELGGEVMDDEGGDLEGAMDAPAGDDEDPMMELADDELNEDDIVQEVARRVAARLLREKKQDAMANKLAERIFRRLASK